MCFNALLVQFLVTLSLNLCLVSDILGDDGYAREQPSPGTELSGAWPGTRTSARGTGSAPWSPQVARPDLGPDAW